MLYKPAALLLLLFPAMLHAQQKIRAFEAHDFIGKNVSVEGRVVNVIINANTKTIDIGLNYWRNKEEILTLLIHFKKITKAKETYYNSLNGQMINFNGKIQSINGKDMIFSTSPKIAIETEISVPTF